MSRLVVGVLFVFGITAGGCGGEDDGGTGDRFQVDDEVVLDRTTGLEWQRYASTDDLTQTSAVDACIALVLQGGGWRVPTVEELLTIVDYESLPVAIDTVVFPGTPNRQFWTASAPARGWNQPPASGFYAISFTDGALQYTSFPDPYRVRCVRGTSSLPYPHEFELNADQTVAEDLTSGLTWELRLTSDERTLDDAQQYCASLDLEGGGWRLPTLDEYRYAVCYSSSIGQRCFGWGDPMYALYWTSTPTAADPDLVWTMRFGGSLGAAGYETQHRTDGYARAQCVR